MKAAFSDWNFTHVLKQRQFRKEMADTDLAMDLFTFQSEHQRGVEGRDEF